jgi:hypothetical protein
MLHDNLGLVRAVVRLGTTDWSRAPGINGKLEPQDRVPRTVLIETVPPILHHGADGRSNGGVNIIPDSKSLGKLRRVAIRLEVPKVSARDGKGRGGTAEGGAVLREHEQVIVELIRHGGGDIAGLWLGPPNLRWNVDHQGGSGAGTGTEG